MNLRKTYCFLSLSKLFARLGKKVLYITYPTVKYFLTVLSVLNINFFLTCKIRFTSEYAMKSGMFTVVTQNSTIYTINCARVILLSILLISHQRKL